MVVGHIARKKGHFYYIDRNGHVYERNLHTKHTRMTDVKITRKPHHLMYIDGSGNIHERPMRFGKRR